MADDAIETRLYLSDAVMLEGSLYDISDAGARVIGRTDGLEVGQEVWLAILYSLAYSVEYLCRIQRIESDECFGVRFKGQIKRCLKWPPRRPGE